jgi:hypothetical protein
VVYEIIRRTPKFSAGMTTNVADDFFLFFGMVFETSVASITTITTTTTKRLSNTPRSHYNDDRKKERTESKRLFGCVTRIHHRVALDKHATPNTRDPNPYILSTPT